jgi:3-oxoacyl-[acyl-carrier protein] reductase
MKSLEGCTALVTDASGAIGSEIAQALARQGAQVMLHCHKGRAQAESTALRICQSEGKADIYGADITSEAEVRALVNRCAEQFSSLDILIVNAGITADGLLVQMPLERWNTVLATNITGAFLCCKHALRVMLRAKRGRIIGISSIAGMLGNAGQANYAASKAAMIGLILSVAQEYSNRGIRANVIAPGLVDSHMTEQMSPETRADKIDHFLLNRMATPSEVAALAAFLASPEADYINGAVLRIDGGLRL